MKPKNNVLSPLKLKISDKLRTHDFEKDAFIIRKNKEAGITLKKCVLPKEWLEEYNKEPNA